MHLLNLRDQIARVAPGDHLARTDGAELGRALVALVGPKNAALALKGAGRRGLGRFTAPELATVCGFNQRTAERIVAARDFGRLLNAAAPIAADAPAVLGFVPPDITALETEVMLGFALNAGLRVMASLLLAKGGVAGLCITPRDVFTPLVRLSAAFVVLVHNHPSGDPRASDEDIRFTREVARAGRVLGIELIDHIIVAEDGFTSLAAEGFIHRFRFRAPGALPAAGWLGDLPSRVDRKGSSFGLGPGLQSEFFAATRRQHAPKLLRLLHARGRRPGTGISEGRAGLQS